MARKRTTPKSSNTQQRPADSSIYRPGGPLLTRAVSGPIATRAVGGPITSRARGGPVKPRAAAEALTIVYVHGIGNKPVPAILKRQCDQALFGIDMGDRTSVAYWVDIRYPQPRGTKSFSAMDGSDSKRNRQRGSPGYCLICRG